MKKEIEQLKEKMVKEFQNNFVHKGEDGDDQPEKWGWTIRGSFPIEVEHFFLSKLSKLEQAVREEVIKSLIQWAEKLEVEKPNSEREEKLYDIKSAWLDEMKKQVISYLQFQLKELN